ncbi:MAG: transposase [Thermodesulfobacteriota bacterium]
MARPLRIEFPGAVYHVTARGNARQDIFLNDTDRRLFLDILSSTMERYNWLCHSYCLMGNHYHLLLETTDPTLSSGMRQLNGMYTQRFNRCHDRVGHVFQGRFKAILVEKESHLLELCRYIVLNPVAAKMVQHPSDYKWSSYQFLATPVKMPDYLSSAWVLGRFSKKSKEARRLYREFIGEGVHGDIEPPWKKLAGQIILGGERFVAEIEEMLAEKKEIKEIPRIQRHLGRPSLARLFPSPASMDKKRRNKAIVTAHLSHGYTLKEIADCIGIHYTTVSRVISSAQHKI